jgi:hypothetical protein
VVALAVGMLGLFFALDGRLPRDPGLYWAELPPVWRALQAGEWGLVGRVLVRPGGWLVGLLAVLAQLGRGPWLLEGLSLVSVGTIVGCAGRLGRALAPGAEARGWGGLTGALLAAGMPLVVVQARLPWIHLPEAALLALVVTILVEDPHLERRRSMVGATLAGAALASVRHSGLVWLVTVVPLLRGRAWWLVLPWGLGALPSLAVLAPYLTAKGAARQSYAARLPGLGQQVLALWGFVPLAAVAAGLVGRVRSRRWDRAALAGGGMVLTGLVMWAVFQAGLDNFTPVALGLVLLAVGGAGRATAGLGALAVGWVGLVSFTPVGAPGLRSLERPWPAPELGLVRELLRASCASGPCRIGASSGVFQPYGEEPGRLELWLLGWDEVELVDLRSGGRDLAVGGAAAVVEWDCPAGSAAWMQRFPRSRAWQRAAHRQHGLAPAWVFRPDPACALVWWAPGGELEGPEPDRGRPPEGRRR